MVKFCQLIFALFLLAGSNAYALVQPESGYRVNESGVVSGYIYPTIQAACVSTHGQQVAVAKTSSFGWPGTASAIWDGPFGCVIFGNGDVQRALGGVRIEANPTPSCPVNSDAVAGGCQCKAGYTESGNQCVGGGTPEACVGSMAKDKTFIRNWTVGYSRSPDETDSKFVGTVNRLPGAGKPVCMGGCKSVQQDVSAPGWKAWISQTPTSQGLYRNSLDVPFTSTGETCTEGTGSAPPIDPQAPEPQCPGYVGEVNGNPGCYGTAANPIIPQAKELPPVRPDAGNPPAGSGPVSPNTGASRTPTAGSGGPAGGPAGAAAGGKGGSAGGTPSQGGTGTVGSPGAGEEQAACGAPGQPVCDVKVDESGTPEKGDAFKDADEKVDKAKTDTDTLREKASGAGDKSSLLEPFRALFVTPPMASCEPFTLPQTVGSATIDPCPVVEGTRSVMAYIWALGGLFMCLFMIKRSV